MTLTTRTPASPRPDPAITDRGDDRALDLLRAIVSELTKIRAAVERQQRPSTLTRAERASLARILPAIAGARGSDLVACRDLFEHESPALTPVLHGLTPQKLGALFARGAGVPIGGYVVEADGFEGHARLWRISATCGVSGER